MKLGKTLLVGSKAIVGSILAGIVMWLVMILGAFVVGIAPTDVWGNRPALGWFLVMIGLLLNVYILGWVYNKLWSWK